MNTKVVLISLGLMLVVEGALLVYFGRTGYDVVCPPNETPIMQSYCQAHESFYNVLFYGGFGSAIVGAILTFLGLLKRGEV